MKWKGMEEDMSNSDMVHRGAGPVDWREGFPEEKKKLVEALLKKCENEPGYFIEHLKQELSGPPLCLLQAVSSKIVSEATNALQMKELAKNLAELEKLDSQLRRMQSRNRNPEVRVTLSSLRTEVSGLKNKTKNITSST